MTWQPMATRGREDRFTFRDFVDCVLIVAAIVLVAYLVGRFVP
jgi:hypothetical protein